MPGITDIEWTGYSANPLKLKLHATGKLVNACIPCSPGCRNCYAGRITGRWWDTSAGDYPGYGAALLKKGEWVLNDRDLHAMLTFRAKPQKGQDRPRVFVCDMTDVFGEWVPFELIDLLFAVFALRPDVEWQVLTKRPERMAEYLLEKTREATSVGGLDLRDRFTRYEMVLRRVDELRAEGYGFIDGAMVGVGWPLRNVWLGTSVEDRQRDDERRPHLLRCPAAVRFLSIEPLLEDLGTLDLTGVDWVIVGSESGPKRRPMQIEWAEGIVGQCKSAGVPVFMKQMEVNGKVSGELSAFPPALQTREFPQIGGRS